MRQPLVAGNWKMNGRLPQARALVDGITHHLPELFRVEVAVMPAFPYLPLVSGLAKETALKWGAQDISKASEGAFTGEISGDMLSDFACHYVLVGHSERRQYHRESDELVAEKFAAAQRANITPVLCVGETLEEREAGNTEVVIARQLQAVLQRVGIQAMANAVVAYEPVWAIGTGKTASPEQAQAVHAFIRRTCDELDATIASQLRLLYGGSVKPDNAATLFAQEDIDGGLIGGAALNVDSFIAIAKAADQ